MMRFPNSNPKPHYQPKCIHNIKELHRTIKKINIKPFAVALTCASTLLFTACTSDNADTVRVIDIADKDDTKNTTEFSIASTLPLDNGQLSVYDLKNNKKMFTAIFKKADDIDSKDADKITPTDRGLTTNISLNKNEIPKNALLLVRMGNNEKQTATYYDAVIDSVVSIPIDKPMLALSSTDKNGNINVLNPTPFSTLSIYRALAKVGWFYEHDALPTNSEFAKLIKQKPEFVSQYKIAHTELANVFGVSSDNLKQINNFNGLVTLAENNTNVNLSPNMRNWLLMLANISIYKQAFNNSNAPYFTFAHDLAKDFYDGDIDGATLNGLGQASANGVKNLVTNNMLIGHIDNNNPNANTNKAIYENQRSVLTDYEKKLKSQLAHWTNRIYNAANTKKQEKLRIQFDNELALYNPINQDANNKSYQITTYDEFRKSNQKNTAYQGVGNTTYAFGLADGIDSLTSINLDDALDILLSADSLIGNYSSDSCTLSINADGVVTLKTDGRKYQTFIDREINDGIYRIGSNNAQNYMLNVSNTNQDTDKRRFIQIRVENSIPKHASTAITASANAMPLKNPEASCHF